MSNRILFVSNYPDSTWAAVIVPELQSLGDVNIHAEEDALAKVDSLQYDLVVIDASGVETDLAELVDRLCCDKQKRSVVVATSAPSWRLARDVFHAGAADYIPRNFDTENLVSACKRALVRAHDERN